MDTDDDVRVREDEPAYVTHFWSAFRAGRTGSRWGDAIVFAVSPDDVARFADLARTEVVALRVTEGEVHETSPEDAARGD